MRIAEVAEFYSPNGGGVRSYIDRKFEAAAEAGHELFVLAPGPRTELEQRAGGGVMWIESPLLPFDANYRMFWHAAPVHAALDRLSPDLAEASSPWRGAWILATWRSSTPRAMFVHADPVASYPQRWLAPVLGRDRVDRLFEAFWAYLRRLAARFDSLVAGGDWLAGRLERFGVGPVARVPLGVDRGVFSPAHRDEALRAQLLRDCGLPGHGKLMLGVGRHHAEKRWPMVISAVTAASAALPLGLVLVGDGMDRARVERAAAKAPHVHLLETIRDRPSLATLLASGDALIHGCESETFGLVPAEALASGLPLVAPDRGGCAELADPRVAETYRAADGRAAAAAITRLLARDPAALRAAALHMAASVRSDTRHYADLFAHYGEVTARGSLVSLRATRRSLPPLAQPPMLEAASQGPAGVGEGVGRS